ncbi:MAG: OsmC family protein, partial [Emcibacteraceae bacterium]|nr:OsmC family protein [Emcibacteraceae bacterium]
SWQRGTQEVFTDSKYSRMHSWEFEGGIMIPASPSHHIVPLPYSNPNYVDPEQAFVASLSSCHMLTFLDICSQEGIVVDDYIDNAEGLLERIGRNKHAMTKVTLNVEAKYSGDVIPNKAKLEELHHKAHEYCFIANSVTTEIITEIIS